MTTKPTPTVIESDLVAAFKALPCLCEGRIDMLRGQHTTPCPRVYAYEVAAEIAAEIAAAREAWGERRIAEAKDIAADFLNAHRRADAVAGLVEAVDGLLAGHDRGELPLHRVIEDVRAALERVKGQP